MALLDSSNDEAIDQSVDVSGTTQFRRPIALQLNHDAETLVVANRNSGSVSLVNVREGQVFGEYKIGGWLTGLAHARRDNVFIATDQQTHAIIALALRHKVKTEVSELWKVPTSQFPTALSLNADENRLAVCGLWSRQVTLIENTNWRSAPSMKRTVDLAFSPGHVCWISSSRLVVADAFGDGVAVIDATSRKVFASQIAGHRTGGVALSNDGQWVAFSDQRVNPLARSTKNDVHWGLMVSNQLRWLSVDSLSRIEDEAGLASLLKDFRNQPIGRPEDAKADLGPLAVSRTGTVALTIGGVNELAIGKRDDDSFGFVPVGRRPMAVPCAENGALGYVANMLDDSVSVVNFEDYSVPAFTTPGLFDVGIRDEQGETKFNPPSLVGLGQRDRYFHDGRYGDLVTILVVGEHQVARELTDQELSDLTLFLKSL